MPSMVSTPYINTIPPEHEPWFPGDEYLERRIRAFIRWNAVVDGGAGQPPLRRPGRSPVHVRVGCRPLRGRVQPFLPRQGRRRLRRPDLRPGPRCPRRLRPGVPRGPAERARSRQLPPRGEGRPAVVPAPPANAGLLGVPDGVDGAEPAQRDRPGPLQPLPAAPRARRHVPGEGVVVRRRRRDGRARVDGGAVDRGTRAARQPHLRRELQPPAARRTGARQRQGDPGVRVDLPRRRLERHQGHLGPGVGRAADARHRRRAAQQDEHDGRRRVPEVRGRDRRLHSGALLRS